MEERAQSQLKASWLLTSRRAITHTHTQVHIPSRGNPAFHKAEVASQWDRRRADRVHMVTIQFSREATWQSQSQLNTPCHPNASLGSCQHAHQTQVPASRRSLICSQACPGTLGGREPAPGGTADPRPPWRPSPSRPALPLWPPYSSGPSHMGSLCFEHPALTFSFFWEQPKVTSAGTILCHRKHLCCSLSCKSSPSLEPIATVWK